MSTSPPSAFLPIAAMMFAAGIGIPVFAAFNSGLGKQLGGPIAATAVTFGVGLAIACVLLVIVGLPTRAAFTFDRPYIWAGAIFMLFYGISIAFAAPRIGVGNAVFFVLLGQLVTAAAIDHFALWGAMPATLTLKRTAGIVVMALGVFLARKPV